MILLLFFSLLAGLITVLSPCILPVLPILLSAGAGVVGRYRFLGIVLGLIISFSFFTLTLTSIVHATGLSPDFLRYVAIVLIAFFGLTMLFPQLEQRLAVITSGVARLGSVVQEQSSHAGTGMLSGFLLGVALGLLWTPCAGPILAAITTLVATNAVTWSAVLMTLAYSIGAAIPMGLISYGGATVIHSTQILSGYTDMIRKGFGLLMIIGAISIGLHFDVLLQQWALKYFPVISLENSQPIQNALSYIQASTPGPQIITAPDFVGIQQWINSPPLSLAQLAGKVVLVDFWTYSCINCIRTLPFLKQWYATYKNNNFIIIGVHTPEFEFKKNIQNVSDAVKRFGIEYPVALDNEYKTWQSYNNHYWPAHYLIDQHGTIQERHFGEGGYQETENAIRRLLGLEPYYPSYAQSGFGGQAPQGPAHPEPGRRTKGRPQQRITPETYLGYERAQHYHPDINLKRDLVAEYSYSGPLGSDQVGLNGSWFVAAQYIQAQNNQCSLDLYFIANKVHLVMESKTPQLVTVLLDAKPVPADYRTSDMNEQGQLMVHEPRKYDVVDLKDNYGNHKVTLQFAQGVSAYAFTFGG